MLNKLQNVFRAPVFEDVEKTNVVRQLHILLLFCLGGAVGYTILIPFFTIDFGNRFIISSIMIPVFLLLLYYLRQGYIRVVSITLITSLWLVMTIAVFINGGIRSPSYTGYLIPILIAGFLNGWWISLRLAVLSVISGLILLWLETQGLLPQLADYNSTDIWLTQSVYIFVIIGILFLSTHALQTTLNRAKQSENKYRSLIEHAADGIFVSDTKGSFIEVNTAATSILGYSREELLKFSISKLMPSKHISRNPIKLEDLRTGKTIIIERDIKHQNGDLIPAEISITSLPDKDILGIIRDITERNSVTNALRESEARLRAIMAGTPTIIFALDTEGVFTLLEGQIFDTLDFEARSLMGKSVFEAFGEPDSNGRDQFQLALNGERTASIERFGDIIFDVRYSPLRDNNGQVIGVTGVATDITEREQLREEQMEKEKLQIALDQQHELSEFRDQLMAMISHDFRTPLTVVQSSADIMYKYQGQLEPDQFEKHINKIISQVTRLDGMLDTTLLLLRGQSGQLQFKPVAMDLALFCKDFVDEMRVTIDDNQKLTLVTEGDISNIPIDKTLLNHILNNLVSNAIKYSPDGGEICISVKRDTDTVLLRVSDEGMGIPLEDQDNLFQPYHRATNVGSIKGTGLGLSIVKLCAESHRGSIDVSSQPTIGTTFTVILPAIPTQPLSPQPIN